jgi:hypothetical protein
MEIDEKTGKYGKGTDDPEDIEEILIEQKIEQNDKNEAVQDLAEDKQVTAAVAEEINELSKKEKAEFKRNLDYMLKSIKSTDSVAANMQDAFVKELKAKIESDVDLQRVISRVRVALQLNSKKEVWFSHEGIRLSLHDFLNKDSTAIIAFTHELMHAHAAQTRNFKYLDAVYDAAEKDLYKIESYKKVFDNIASNKKTVDKDLQEFWKPFIRKSFETGTYSMSVASTVGITDYMHGSISGVLSKQQVKDLDLPLNLDKAVKSVVKEYEANGKKIEATKTTGAWHDNDYYFEKFGSEKVKRIADEFQANMGSLYFINRKLFNAYKEVLPNAMGVVEKFIKEEK